MSSHINARRIEEAKRRIESLEAAFAHLSSLLVEEHADAARDVGKATVDAFAEAFAEERLALDGSVGDGSDAPEASE